MNEEGKELAQSDHFKKNNLQLKQKKAKKLIDKSYESSYYEDSSSVEKIKVKKFI